MRSFPAKIVLAAAVMLTTLTREFFVPPFLERGEAGEHDRRLAARGVDEHPTGAGHPLLRREGRGTDAWSADQSQYGNVRAGLPADQRRMRSK